MNNGPARVPARSYFEPEVPLVKRKALEADTPCWAVAQEPCEHSYHLTLWTSAFSSSKLKEMYIPLVAPVVIK